MLQTRFSKSLLVSTVGMLVIYCVFGSLAATNNLFDSSIFQYYGVGITIVMLSLAAFGGRIIITKADRDYLLTLPIEKKTLALNLYIVQIVSFLITNIMLYGLVIPAFLSAEASSYILLPINFVALTVLICSITVIANVLSKKMKIVLGGFLILWLLSALEGFPFTPGAIFMGNMLYGSAVLIVSALLSTVMALRELSNVEFRTAEKLAKMNSLDGKKNRTFDKLRPFWAVFFLNFFALKFSGAASAKSAKKSKWSVKITWLMAGSCILAVCYGLLLPYIGVMDNFMGDMGVVFLPVSLLYIVSFNFKRGLINERAWLSFTALDPRVYFRYILAANMLALITLFLPFAVTNIYLFFIGYQLALSAIISLLIIVPCSAVCTLYLATIVNPVQLKEGIPMKPTQTTLKQALKQILTFIPFFGSLIAILISSISPISVIITAIISLGLILFLSYSHYPWKTFTDKLTEKGFV
jgi:hypothetical protein